MMAALVIVLLPFQMQDMDDNDSSQQYVRSSKHEGQHNNQRNAGQTGFIVQGAPWEQGAGPQRVAPTATAPNTASNEEFPSFGQSAAAAHPSATPMWGPRR